VLLNLAVNARDAMPRGGTLTLTAANKKIDARPAGTNLAAHAGTYVVLEVADTGEGIPPEVRDRIFDPFFTTKAPGSGTGIGLATVHTVVKNHGGFITVDSEVGRGTTFKIYLPAEAAQRTGDLAPAEAEPPRGQGELILVADDEVSIRDITRQTLEGHGYRVLTAADGAEAVALFARQPDEIALVLVDMMMPIMDGMATIPALRRHNPEARIIAISGLAITEDTAKAAQASASDFLAKPYTTRTLLQLLADVIARPHPAPQ
jgi:CheY-like chemotaxis protein